VLTFTEKGEIKVLCQSDYGSASNSGELSRQPNGESREMEWGKVSQGIEDSCQGSRTRNQWRWKGKERKGKERKGIMEERKPNMK
jgi:hypothetical protein